MNLVIVESPTKAKTISRFLGKDFEVESSNGHVRDLPKGELGVDLENDFSPKYVIPKKAQKTTTRLKKAAKTADRLILATDEDREGEAIAWHLLNILDYKGKAERIVFHEITKSAVEEALKNPRAVDLNLVDAQQARRILDRLVGYKLSPFLWKKLMRGLSAGRVQSVALKLIAEREKEIKSFKSRDYWTIFALVQKSGEDDKLFSASLVKIDNKPVSKPGITKEKEAETIKKDLEKDSCSWEIESIEKKAKEISPRPPFTTSTLQQAAWQKLRFSAKKTMRVAQQLYEGVELEKEGGSTGLITYMRTDSLNISETALTQARMFLKEKFGDQYCLLRPRYFKTKNKTAQEAHEAIRPANPGLMPESIKKELSLDQFKLYNLIWQRFLAAQMPKAIFDGTTISILAKGAKQYILSATGSVLKFDGFLKIYPMSIKEETLPDISKSDNLIPKEVVKEEHQTQPPPRYNDASLVKVLEVHGIGRPSTYAQIIVTLEARNYVERDETKKFKPTEIGGKVNDLLAEHFPDIVDVGFTAQMENNLDEIAAGKIQYPPVVRDFYIPFEKLLAEKYETVEKKELAEETSEVCGSCGKPMVIKYGRFGKFMACSGFPECKNTKPLPPKQLGVECPICGDGNVIERKTKRGKLFYGCSNWPKCNFAVWQRPTGELCPDCKAPLTELKDKIKCSNRLCGYSQTRAV